MGLPVACALTIAAAVLSLVPRFADATPDLQVVSMAESHALREEVRDAFVHTYDSYMRNAFPKDELLPLSCEGKDTLGSYALTLVDSLDTLAVLGNWTEFGKSAKVRKRERVAIAAAMASSANGVTSIASPSPRPKINEVGG